MGKQCHGLHVTEREKDDPSQDSNHTSSAIQAGRLEGHLDLSLALECIITDADRYSITVTSKNTHNHEDRSEPSPVRQSLSKLIGIDLTETQIRLSLLQLTIQL